MHRAAAEKREREMTNVFEEEAAKTKKAIEELDSSVCALRQTLTGECFYSFATSPADARTRITDISEQTNELVRTLEVCLRT